jgi:hypothetical protein
MLRIIGFAHPNEYRRIGETGELLGTHVWIDEMLRETRGDFAFAHVSFQAVSP